MSGHTDDCIFKTTGYCDCGWWNEIGAYVPEDKDALIERLQKELGEARAALAFGTNADAYYNLEGALIDMRRTGVADIVCIRTIERVQQQIAAVAKAIRSIDGGGKP